MTIRSTHVSLWADKGARDTESKRARQQKTSEKKRQYSYVGTALLGLVAIYFLIPLYWLVISATKDTGDLLNSFGFWFSSHWNLWSNLNDLFTYQDGIYQSWLINSFFYAIVCASVTAAICSMAGYALAKYLFPGRDLVFSIILGAVFVPITALALPLYLLMSKWQLANTYLAVMLPFFVSPLGVYLARIYATASIPDELLDAARVDGAGELRTFLQVGIPILSPGLVTIFLFQFIAVWNSFFLPLVMLSEPRLFPLSLGLQTWNIGQASYSKLVYNLLITGSFVSVLPLIVLFLLLQRYWRNGIISGSLKS